MRMALLTLILLLCPAPSYARKINQVPLSKIMELWDSPSQLSQQKDTVGVEIEGVMPTPNGKNAVLSKVVRSFIVNWLGAQPHVTLVKEEHKANFVEAFYKKSKMKFDFTGDKTIKPPEGFQGVEFKSPIMRTQEDFALFAGLIEALHQKLGFVVEPNSTGLHVHHGFELSSNQERMILLLVMEELEDELLYFFKPKAGRMNYIESIKDQVKHWLAHPEGFEHFLDKVHGNYPIMRLKHLRGVANFGTAELRIFNSTVDPETIFKDIYFMKNLITMIKTRNPVLLKLIRGRLTEAQKMKLIQSMHQIPSCKTYLEDAA